MTNRKTLKKILKKQQLLAGLLVIGLFIVPFASPKNVSAATKPKAKATHQEQGTDKALLINQSNRFLVLPPGKAATVWFDFQNTGTSTWTNQDPAPISLNTDDPMRRKSKFEFKAAGKPSSKRKPGEWRAFWRPTRLMQKNIKPGETGRFRFALKAPKKPGVWREKFALVRGKDTKILGGEAEFVIVVGKQGDPAVVYQAKPKSPTISFWVKPGERIYTPVEFRNIGYATWRNEGFGVTNLVPVPSDEAAATQTVGSLTVQSTPAITKPAPRAKTTTALLDVVAPSAAGVYRGSFGLYGPHGLINGSQFTVEAKVTEEPKPVLDAEPIVRVGIFAPTKPVEITASGAFEIRRADTNELISTEQAGAVSTVTYDSELGEYDLTTPTITSSYLAPLRFIPTTPDIIIEIKSFSNRRTITLDGVETTINDNKFRGIIELRYAEATKKLWVINELPLEQYLKGLAETSNEPHPEFTKALIVAARTYALYHSSYQSKHRSENYHINSTTDQLYRGYNFELRTPNITAAVVETRGLVITHAIEITDKNKAGAIVAAYSSCTDGRTRSYYERWGGVANAYPYLVSVPDPNGICTNQRWLQGLDGNHMVGMSATGALKTSEKDRLTYDALLKYYYTGVEIKKAYL